MRGSVLPLMAVGWLGALACGRLGFDPGSEQDDVGIPDAGPQVDAVPAALALTLTATAGVTTLDTELCLTRAAMVRVIVTTDAFETGWTAADLASYADAGPAALLASTALVPASAGCTTFVHPVAGEATAFNVYASAEVAATAEVDLDEAAAALEPTVELVTFDAGAGHTQRYYVSLPERYYRDPSAPLPLLLFLHGAGEDGDDVGANIDLLLTRSTLMRELIDRQPSLANHPFVVVAPQCNANIGACWGLGRPDGHAGPDRRPGRRRGDARSGSDVRDRAVDRRRRHLELRTAQSGDRRHRADGEHVRGRRIVDATHLRPRRRGGLGVP
jgi:hypothetical protein